MIVHRAAWVLPIAAPPIRNGWVAVEGGRIAALGADDPAAPHESGDRRAILPALVNAHVHLELSWMRGAVPPAPSMPGWAARLIAARRGRDDAVPAIEDAVREARAFGTALVGDVTNTLAAYNLLSNGALSAAVFWEQLGFATRDGDACIAEKRAHADAMRPNARLRVSVVPHAPYSVSPELLSAIAARERGPISIHLAESADELQFLRDGSGAWRGLLESLGAWNPAWVPPGSGPVEYLRRAGLLDDRLIAVHGVHLTDDELALLARAGATVVTCPRSNRWTGAGDPPVARFYASGVRIAVGTDSLASVEDLNVFAELAAMRALAPRVPAARLLESATRAGASALGFGADVGTIAPGMRAELIAVRVPAGVEDVEEYLVGGMASGIGARDIRWLAGG